MSGSEIVAVGTPAELPRGEGCIHLDRRDGVPVVVLDNPTARNAMSPGMMVDLQAVVARLEASPPAVLLVTGAGTRAFCAGGDLRSVRQHLLSARSAVGMHDFMADVLDRLTALPTVVVAAVEGAALGGGAELLTACDLVFAGSSAKIGFVHVRLGVSPGWGGGQRLVARVGSARALKLLLSMEPPSAGLAARLGLVDGICQPGGALAAALAHAKAIEALPAAAVAAAVEIARTGGRSVERRHFAGLWAGEAHLKALAAASQGRR